MSTPTFPPDLPGPSAFSWIASLEALASESPGPRAVRKLTKVQAAEASVSWTFKAPEYQVFMDWWRDDLLRGHRWFVVDLPCALGIRPHLARFVEHRTSDARGHRLFNVVSKLEVRVRQIEASIFDIYLTSNIYPLLTGESLEAGIQPTSLTLTAPLPYGFEELQSALTPIGLTMQSLTVLYNSGFDEVSPDLVPTSLTMVNALTGFDYGIESITNLVTPRGMTMKSLRIETDYDIEAIASSLTVTGVTLT